MYKKPLLLFLLLFSIFSVFSQDLDRLERQIDSTYLKKPAAAKAHLLRYLAYEDELVDSLVVQGYSKLGVSYTQLAQYDSAVHYFDKGIEKAGEHLAHRAKVRLNLAISYRHMAEYAKSLEVLALAQDEFDLLQNDDGLAMVHGEMASNYTYMGDYEAAIAHLKEALAMFGEANMTHNAWAVRQKLANTYFNSGDYTFAKDLYVKVLDHLEQDKNRNYYYTLMNYSDCLYYLDELEAAKQSIVKVIAGLKELNDMQYHYFAINKLAAIHQKQGNLGAAEAAYQKAYAGLYGIGSPRIMEVAGFYIALLNEMGKYGAARAVIDEVTTLAPTTPIKMNAKAEVFYLTQQIDTYKGLHQFEKALTLMERKVSLEDSLQEATNELKVQEIQEAYQNDLQREENIVLAHNNELLQENNRKQTNITLLIVLLSVLVVGVIFYVYYKNKKELALKREAVAHLAESNQSLEEKRKLEKELNLQKEKTLQDREREIAAISLEMANLQQSIEEVVQPQQENNALPKNVTQKLGHLLREKNYWDFFKKRFVEVHPRFYERLKQEYPALSDTEVDFCALVKVRLSNKEIGSLLGISHTSVISKKYRIRKKMDLQQQDVSLEAFIESF